MSMNVSMNPGSTYQTPPPPPPTKAGVDGLESKFNELDSKLKANPNDRGAKEELNKLELDIQKAIAGEEGKPGGGDPAMLNRLDSLLQNAVDLHNKTFKNGDPGMGEANTANGG